MCMYMSHIYRETNIVAKIKLNSEKMYDSLVLCVCFNFGEKNVWNVVPQKHKTMEMCKCARIYCLTLSAVAQR